jgi:hypothetical protein
MAILREKTNRPLQLPSRAREFAVLREVNLQETVILGALVRTFTEPLPTQLPSSDRKNAASSA